MPRFVVLFHACPADYERPSHWDLMLESGEVLRTWALTTRIGSVGFSPQQIDPMAGWTEVHATGDISAKALGDHRLAFLQFEGELSGGRGSVARVDAGEYGIEQASVDRLVLNFAGATLQGRWQLERDPAESTTGQASAQRWRLSRL